MYQKCCKAFPKCVLGKTQWHPIEIILRYFQILSQPKLGWIPLKFCQDVFELSRSLKSFGRYQKCCEAFPKCVLGEIQLHPIEIFVRRFQILSQPKICWNLLNLFYDVFELSPSPISIVWYQKLCEAFPRYVLGEFQLRRIEIIVRLFQTVFTRNCIASFWNCSKTLPNCVLAEIQLHLVENIVKVFQICLGQNSIASCLKYSKTFSTCVPGEILLHPIENIFKHFQFVC